MSKVWFVSAEMAPYCKTGGLGDVVGHLPLALSRHGVEVGVIIPYYWEALRSGLEIRIFLKDLWAPLKDLWLPYDVYISEPQGNVRVFLIKREDLYFRPNLYRDAKDDYYDNMARFCFFCHACLGLLSKLVEVPSVVHCHDWHTGLLCPLILENPHLFKAATRQVFTVHNIAYQGIYPKESFSLTGLPSERYFHPEGLEFWGNVNLMKAGLNYAHIITTVSPTHAEELKDPWVSRGLEGIFIKRAESLYGILNGVDYNTWNPENDPYIKAHFSSKDISGKRLCKKDLLEYFRLSQADEDRPLVGMVTRLDYQKGIDLVLNGMEQIIQMGANFVLVGEGDERYQEGLLWLKERFPDRIGLYLGRNEGLAHKVIAGADMLLLPSLFEPCGLTQMYALRYGTIPIGRATGGLKDTILPYDPISGSGYGILFQHFDVNGMLWGVKEAITLYRDKKSWEQMVKNAFSQDFSWDRAAKAYIELYSKLIPQ